jgi:hypothetical protein
LKNCFNFMMGNFVIEKTLTCFGSLEGKLTQLVI